MKLKGRAAIVTGGGRGIGREIAKLFAAEGAGVVVSARSSDQIAKVVEEIVAGGGTGVGVSADVSREEDVQRIVAETMDKFGRVDILVNNAGIIRTGPLVAVDSAEWRQVIEINLMGTFHCTKAVVPILIEQQWGRIINISSRSGKLGHPYLSAYCASKHGVVGFTKSIAEELAPFNITVNAICPGLVETDMVPETVKQQAGSGIIKPRQIADLALYLASDSASAITGESINVFGNTKLNLSF
jgi:NAD(P)-dependent dehydrogenase (short-subunit alcohol dehydrogenase family)